MWSVGKPGKNTDSGLSAKVLKALGIFGSIEALRMLCSVVRTKFAAIWIGTAGVGVISLYTAAFDMIRSVMSLNLRQSSIPRIASADDADRGHVCRSVETLGLFIGLAATVIVALLSPLLSYITFGNYDYAWGFALLAPTMLAASLSEARSAVLQGIGRLRALALATFYGVLAATVIAIPLFYFFRMAAIVPVLIIIPVLTLVFLYSTSGTKVSFPPAEKRLLLQTIKGLVKLGSFITAGVAVGFVADYLLRIYIGREASVDDVGIFQAGYTIIKSYVGLFFTAITMEFFPRLSATIRRRRYTSLIVAHEINISIAVLLPAVIVFLSANDLIIRILYSSDFLAAVPYISIAIIATFLRVVSWSFSYVIIANGGGKLYVFTESVSAVSLLVLSYFGWRMFGFAGLGCAYIGQFLIFTAVTWIVCHRNFGLRMPLSVSRNAALAIVLSSAALFLRIFFGWWQPLLLLVFPISYWLISRYKSRARGREVRL